MKHGNVGVVMAGFCTNILNQPQGGCYTMIP